MVKKLWVGIAFFIGLAVLLAWWVSSVLVGSFTPSQARSSGSVRVVRGNTFDYGSRLSSGSLGGSSVVSLDAFSSVYGLGVSGFDGLGYTSYGAGVSLTDDIAGFRFILDSFGAPIAFIVSEGTDLVSSVGDAFKPLAVSEGTLYFNALTNGLTLSDGSPLLTASLKSIDSDSYSVGSYESLSEDIWGSLADTINSGEFYSFVENSTGDIYAVRKFDGGYSYYILEAYDDTINARFVGIRLKSYSEDITSKMLKQGISQFSLYKVKGGVLWIKY